MNNKTSHDLSAGVASLNLNNLIELANIACGQAKTECERALSELQNCLVYSVDQKIRGAMYASARLRDAGKAAAIAFENLHYLTEAKTREEILIERK